VVMAGLVELMVRFADFLAVLNARGGARWHYH